MIRDAKALQASERQYTQECSAKLTYGEALAILSALWREARSLNPDFPGDWEADLEPDLAVARASNGLPPTP